MPPTLPTAKQPTSTKDTEQPKDVPSLVAKEEPILHDSKYYIDDEMAVFLVERRLFKVHRHFLIRELEFFRALFQLPNGEGNSGEGKTDESPIPLPGVAAEEFSSLLDYFYEGPYCNYEFPEPRSRHWTRILTISTRFGFERVRDQAIARLTHCLDPIEKIFLAQSCDVPQWLFPAYEAVCERDGPLEVWEAERIGVRTAILLAQAREELYRSISWGAPSPNLPINTLPVPQPILPPAPPPLFTKRRVRRVLDEVFN